MQRAFRVAPRDAEVHVHAVFARALSEDPHDGRLPALADRHRGAGQALLEPRT